ncbi:MAG: UPF0175 family protein [Verrucomicrobiota bacterium]
MKALQIEYPESWPAAAGASSEQFEGEARMALAMKLFEMGRLTSGQAAQLAWSFARRLSPDLSAMECSVRSLGFR